MNKYHNEHCNLVQVITQEIFEGEYVEVQKNGTKNMYKAITNFNQFGQWVSPTKKLVVGINNINGVGSDLFKGGYITAQMAKDWESSHTYSAKEVVIYFIDVEKRKIALFYRSKGCTYTKMAPGIVGSKLVEGYNSIQPN